MRQHLEVMIYGVALLLFVAYWLTPNPASSLCLGLAIVLHICRLRLPATLANTLHVASGMVGSFVLSVPIMLMMSAFGVYDRSLGQDFVGNYIWAVFLVVVPGVVLLAALRWFKKQLVREDLGSPPIQP